MIVLAYVRNNSMAFCTTPTHAMAYAFFLGIDVASDDEDAPDSVVCSLLEKSQDDDATSYRLDSVRTFDAETRPEDIAEQLQSVVLDAPYTARTSFVVNRKPDRGAAVYDALDELGLPVRAVALTASGEETARVPGSDDEERATEQEVVTVLAEAHRDGILTLQHRETKEATELARSLQHYAALAVDGADTEDAVAPNGENAENEGEALPVSFRALVTSTALATWFASQQSFDPTSRLKETPHTTSEPMTE